MAISAKQAKLKNMLIDESQTSSRWQVGLRSKAK